MPGPTDPKTASTPVISPEGEGLLKPLEIPKKIELPKILPQKDFPTKKDVFGSREVPHARDMARVPKEFGRRLSRLLSFRDAQGADRPKLDVKSVIKEWPKLAPQVYQRLLSSPVLRQMKDQALQAFLEKRLTEAHTGSGKAENNKQTAAPSKNLITQLFRLRHQVDDKPALREVLKHEIKLAKELLKSRVDEVREKTGQAGQSKTEEGRKLSSKEAHKNVLDALLPEQGESSFEGLLKRALLGAELAPEVPHGKKAVLGSKTEGEWKTFFSNILKLGSTEKAVSKETRSIVDTLFRGVYKALADQKGLVMVADLKLSEGEQQVLEKFVRILIDNPELAKQLQQLKPGEGLPQEFLKKLGEELQYTKVVHTPEGQGKSQSPEVLMGQLRSQVNPQAMARMEQSLVQERQRKQEELKEQGLGLSQRDEDFREDPKNPLFYQGDYPLRDRAWRPGRPKNWILFGYFIGAAVVGLGFYLLLRNLNFL